MGSKADVPCGFVELFEHPIEGQAHAVCRVASVLHKDDAWFVLRDVGIVDCVAFCIGGVIFGQDSAFILCYSDAVIKEQVVLQ